jgi:hypothetical protein
VSNKPTNAEIEAALHRMAESRRFVEAAFRPSEALRVTARELARTNWKS